MCVLDSCVLMMFMCVMLMVVSGGWNCKKKRFLVLFFCVGMN